MKEYKLYVLQRCPYCNKVRRFLEEKGIEVEIKDVDVASNQEELMNIGGIDQVPMLTIDGEPMYESDAIINYFENL